MSEMSDSPPAGGPTTESNETPAAPSQPVTPPPASSQPVTQNSGTPEMGSLLTALAALPEKIVDSLRESMQPATPPAQTGGQTQTPAQAESPAGAQQTARNPGQKSFTEWWFGK